MVNPTMVMHYWHIRGLVLVPFFSPKKNKTAGSVEVRDTGTTDIPQVLQSPGI